MKEIKAYLNAVAYERYTKHSKLTDCFTQKQSSILITLLPLYELPVQYLFFHDYIVTKNRYIF